MIHITSKKTICPHLQPDYFHHNNFLKSYSTSKNYTTSIIVIMFDELLSQMETALSETKKVKQTLQPFRPEPINYESPLIDCTKTYGKVASFTRSERFKLPEKQQLCASHIQWPKKAQTIEPKQFSFSKKDRFEREKPKYTETYINPDFNVLKKNTTNNVPIYKSPAKQLSESKVSVSTVDSETFRAPGLYNPKEESKIKNGQFSKDGRFKVQKQVYQDTPLLVNESQTRKRPPMSTVMKPKTSKTKHLISKQQQEQLRERLKLVYWKSIPLQLDRLFKNNIGPVIKEDYFSLAKLQGTEKRCALLMLMDRLNHLRGGYQQDIATKMDSACPVIYRKSTPKPFKFSEMEPGPDYYHPADDYIKPQPKAFSFKKEGLKKKMVEYDYRDYEIQEQIIKPGGNIIINPSHQEHKLTPQELADLERGPGFYDCLFKLVEERTDKGAVAYQELTTKNDRQNNCVEIKEVNDGVYFPSYAAVDPNIAAPLYKEPANVNPPHLPDKVVFPQHWLFYDGDLNKVRAQIAKNVLLAKNMTFSQYKEYKDKFARFKEYLALQKKGPEAGQYQVQYQAIDPHQPNIDFNKQEEKTLIEPIVKPEGHYAGDNLVLDPQEPKPHLPNIDFKKMEGRPQEVVDPDEEPREGDRIILNPKRPEAHIPNVFFKKCQARDDNDEPEEARQVEGDVIRLNPKPIESHIPSVNFEKQSKRPQLQQQQAEQKEEVKLSQNKQESQKQKIKGVPFSRLSSVKIVPLLREKSKIKQTNKQQSENNQ